VKRVKLIAIASIPIILAGCGVFLRPINLPDGSVGYHIGCTGYSPKGRLLTFADCYAKAGEICGTKGYEFLGGGASPPDKTVTPIAGHPNLIQGEIYIKCK